MDNTQSPQNLPFQSSQPTLLTAAEVARLLNVSTSWVREHSTTKSPRLPAIKMGSGKTACVRYHHADIMDFVETLRQSARDRAANKKWRH